MRPQQASIQPAVFPAPIKGMNSISALSMMEPSDNIYSINIDASAYGLKVRPGCIQYGDDFTAGVTTIIPYMGTAEDGSEDFLFAADTAGIWDASSVPSVPTKDYTWVTTTADPAGYCSYDIFTNDSGARVLLVCDEGNGAVFYTESTQAWAALSVTGPTETDLIHVVTWKNRVWFVEKGSGSAWYSAAGTYSGTLTEFNFASKFSKGGYLKSIHTWTLDSGEGPDDYIVALSSAGDVVVYQGTDPSAAATFSIVGVFYVGELPLGRRVASEFGGDLLILSSYGVVRCSDLVRGVNPFTFEGSLSYKINRDMNSLMSETISSRGWEIKVQPDLAKIIISTPKLSNTPHTQYVYDVNVQAWSTWRGIPMICGDTYKNAFYTGNSTNIYKLTGTHDNLTLLTSDSPQPIEWSFLTGYSDLGMPEMEKCVELIRPRFLSGGQPTIRAKAYYDYDLSNIQAAVGSVVGSSEPVWDTDLWDNAVWGAADSTYFEDLVGSSGMGKNVALAMSGKTLTQETFIEAGLLVRASIDSKGLL